MENISKWAIAKIQEHFKAPVPIEDLCKQLIDPFILYHIENEYAKNKSKVPHKIDFIEINIYNTSYQSEEYKLIHLYGKEVCKYYKKQGWKKITYKHKFGLCEWFYTLRFYAK